MPTLEEFSKHELLPYHRKRCQIKTSSTNYHLISQHICQPKLQQEECLSIEKNLRAISLHHSPKDYEETINDALRRQSKNMPCYISEQNFQSMIEGSNFFLNEHGKLPFKTGQNTPMEIKIAKTNRKRPDSFQFSEISNFEYPKLINEYKMSQKFASIKQQRGISELALLQIFGKHYFDTIWQECENLSLKNKRKVTFSARAIVGYMEQANELRAVVGQTWHSYSQMKVLREHFYRYRDQLKQKQFQDLLTSARAEQDVWRYNDKYEQLIVDFSLIKNYSIAQYIEGEFTINQGERFNVYKKRNLKYEDDDNDDNDAQVKLGKRTKQTEFDFLKDADGGYDSDWELDFLPCKLSPSKQNLLHKGKQFDSAKGFS